MRTPLVAALPLFLLLLIFPQRMSAQLNAQETLKPVPYSHPGLTVDLGVGLWAWPLPMDWDGDGDLDLLVSCPDVPFNGTWLFKNPGGDTKMPTFKPPVKVGPGMHSIQISYVDGKPRLLTPGTEWVDFLGKQIEKQVSIHPKKNIHPNRVRANQWRYADYDNDGAQDLIIGIGDWTDYGWDDAFNAEGLWTNGPLRGYVYLLHNNGTTEKPKYADPIKLEAAGLPVEVFGMPTPNLADFDGDGDLDLLCGEFLDGFTYFENTGTRSEAKFAAGRRLTHEGQPLKMDLQMITPTAIDWDGDEDVDVIVGDEDGRVALVEHTGQVEDGLPQFLPPRYFQQEAGNLKFGALATPVSVDWDADGDEDLVVGNSAGYIAWIENLDGGNPPRWAAPRKLEANDEIIRIQAGANGSIQGPAEAKWGYTTLSVADWDHDGRMDLIVNSIWGRIEWYRNEGGTPPRLSAAQPVEVAWKGEPPRPEWNWWKPDANELVTQWRTTPVAVDLDEDGLTDLVTLDHEGYLAWFRRMREEDGLVLQPGQRIFQTTTGKPLRFNDSRAGRSGRRKWCFADWDGDGRKDILINSQNVSLLRNVSTEERPWTFEDAGPLHSHRLAGHTTSPTTVDWNDDGKPDLLIGAEDGHFYYIENNWQPLDPRKLGDWNVETRLKRVGTLANGEIAYGNRTYVWQEVPAAFRDWQFLQTDGGVSSRVIVTATHSGDVYFATSASAKGAELKDWQAVEDARFHYTDQGHTEMQIYQKAIGPGERISIPQLSWTGGILLLPPAEAASP